MKHPCFGSKPAPGVALVVWAADGPVLWVIRTMDPDGRMTLVDPDDPTVFVEGAPYEPDLDVLFPSTEIAKAYIRLMGERWR